MSGLVGGGGLLLGIGAVGVGCTGSDAPSGGAEDWAGWIHIAGDGRITVSSPRIEMGQGIVSTLASLVADELDADWSLVTVQPAPLDLAYGDQVTDGSDSLRSFWMQLRTLGATARTQLIQAAAARWSVEASACTTETGFVVHSGSGRRFAYGELAEAAARLAVPKSVSLKEPRRFTLIGKRAPRLDLPAMVDGSLEFTADIRLPGILNAAIAHSPRVGGRVRSVEDTDAKAMPGVRAVVDLGHAVAVVADSWWTATRALQALRIDWSDAGSRVVDDAEMWPLLREACRKSAPATADLGDVAAALAAARGAITAEEFEVTYQAHAPMEPMVCVADARGDRCEVFAPTQAPWSAYREAWQAGLSGRHQLAERLGRKLSGQAGERVRVHAMPVGGAFGRRLEHDFVREAVAISREVEAPVKLIWSREEDTRNDFYRPASCHRIEAALDESGRLAAWRDRIAGSGIIGSESEFTYDCPNYRVEVARLEIGLPTGSVRSVSDTPSAFARETTIDRLAEVAGSDALQFRIAHLSRRPRLRAALELAAEKAVWGSPPAAGRGLGVAVHSCRGSHVAQVAEVSLDPAGIVRVHRVVCAIDCGFVVNPDMVRAQLEGGIVFGLTSALKGEISVRDGRVEQGNFDAYPLLRMNETPEIEVHLVESDEEPGGVGEVGVPPIAPAVVNALYTATGLRARRLPIRIP